MSPIRVGEPTLVGAAWRYRILVLFAVLAFLAAGVAYAQTRPEMYTATATLALQDPRSGSVFGTPTGQAPDRYAADQIAVLRAPQVAAAAAAVAAAKTPPLALTAADFSANEVVSGTPLNGNLVQVSFTAVDAQSALAGVDAIKTAYEQTVQSAVAAQLASLVAQIDSELSAINDQLASPARGNPQSPAQQAALIARRDTLAAKRDQVVVDASSGSNGVALYLAPQTTTHTSRLVARLPLLAAAGVLGLVSGLVAAYALASRRRAFRSGAEPEVLLDAPLIAEIPRFDRSRTLPVADEERSSASAAFRSAALFIQARQAAAGARDLPRRRMRPAPRRLLVASSARRDGRSVVVANLGIALADNGLSTLLVDADPHTGGLSRLLRGRFELVTAGAAAPDGGPGRGAVPEFDMAAGVKGLTVPAGMVLEDVVRAALSPARLALLRLDREPQATEDAERDKRFQELEADFNVVIIDGPPLNGVGPYWPVLRRADSAVVLINNKTPVAQVEELSRLMGAIELSTFGYVYNHRPRLRRGANKAAAKAGAPVAAAAVAATRPPQSPPAPGPDLTMSA